MPADHSVVLQYRRVEGELSTGRIALLPIVPTEETARCLEDFDRLPYTKMLVRFARELREFPEAKAAIMRIDRPGLLPYALDEETTALLRTDPVAAIQSMTYTTPSLGKIHVVKEEKPLEVDPIRAGHETLADALGEQIYVKRRSSALECPGCGYWGPVHTNSFKCTKKCAREGHARTFRVTLTKLWAVFSTEDLLESTLPKFYLPRTWNVGRLWVTKAELIEMYTAYKAEKEYACSVSKVM
jgi:hypothetical protein